MKQKTLKILELLLLLLIVSVCVLSVFESKILDNKINVILFLIIPFLSLFFIEILKISKELKNKEIQKEIELLEDIDDSIILDKIIESTTIEEKNNIKPEEELTIKIPVEDIKTKIESINKELSEEDNDLEKTEVLFTQDEIKKIIENELKSTEVVEKTKKTKKESTKTVENFDNIKNKST